MDTCPACGEEIIAGVENCDNCGYDLTDLGRPRSRSSIDKSLHKSLVGDLRDHPAVVVPKHRKVQDVLASMVLRRDGCAVVIDEENRVVGVFTERDLIMKVANKDPGLMEAPVSEVMTKDPVLLEEDAPMAYALHQMDLGGYRHIPLVKNGKPAGMISVRDIVTFIGEHFLADEATAE